MSLQNFTDGMPILILFAAISAMMIVVFEVTYSRTAKTNKKISDTQVSQVRSIMGASLGQRLLFGWAQVWREVARPEETIRLLAIDPHSPAEFRCNGTARNVPELYEAFDVSEGDGMWMPAESRVGIW